MSTNDFSFIFGIAVGFLGTLIIEIVFLLICAVLTRKEEDDEEDE